MNSVLGTLIGLITAAIFVTDLFLPRGAAIGVAYTLPILISLRLESARFTTFLFFIVNVLVIIGYFFSPVSHEAFWIAVFNRTMAFFANAVATFFVVRMTRSVKIAKCRLHQQQAVVELGKKALKGEDTLSFLNDACSLIARGLGSHYAKVLKILPDENSVLLIAGYGWKDGVVGKWKEPLVPGTMSYYSLHEAAPVIVENLKSETRFKPPDLLLEHGVTSCINVIIHLEKSPYGIIEADTRQRHHFIQEDLYFLKLVSNVISSAIRRKNMEEALVHSNRELDQFVSIASHDLQEPLNKITAFSELMAMNTSDEENGLKEYAEQIEKSATRMGNLIQNLLLFSRLKKQEIAFETVDLNILIQDVVNELQFKIERHKAEIKIGPLPAIQGNYFQMHQLFSNLISNSLKYCCPVGHPIVEIGSQEKENGFVEIFVKDNGIGFEEQFADQIFLPFKRLHGVGKYEGSGMGLAICKKIVDYHGGKILAKSQPNKGSTFTILFPK
jgi:signal transduction histidine kinase